MPTPKQSRTGGSSPRACSAWAIYDGKTIVERTATGQLAVFFAREDAETRLPEISQGYYNKRAKLEIRPVEIIEQNAKDQAPAESGLPASACSPIRGFRVICEKWSPPLTTIVRARSASKARFRCWDSARDVGYNLKIGELKVRRAPEYDDAKLIEGRCYGEDYASSILSENDQALAQPERNQTPTP